ncbi:GlxA family transcriptional regulator [Herbaspirillum huttiense]|uniref:GlxA family transcriptional regulator n=1 Tax=Herbaspirillum huttiense TaxID=863372 RepID=UPI0039AF8120
MKKPKRVVILGLPPVDALDVTGPAEVFAYANRLSQPGAVPYQVELISAGADLYLESETGIGLRGHATLGQERKSAKRIDTLVVATGFAALAHRNPEAIAWIRSSAPKVRRVCSICVGSFVLAEAGLLNGRKATTHWRMARQLAETYPQVRVDPAPIWMMDGNIYTSAGISAGIDLALSLVAEDLGDGLALDIAKNMVLFLRRPGGQAQFSVSLQSQQASGSSLDALRLWISEHLDAQLTVEIMADHMAMSARTLIRTFQRELNTTPAKYVEEVRLEAVSRALELGGQSLEDIARKCGYNSVDVLRKAFTRRLGVSPKDYVERFSPSGDPPS